MLYFFVIWDDQHRYTNMNNKDHQVATYPAVQTPASRVKYYQLKDSERRVSDLFSEIWFLWLNCLAVYNAVLRRCIVLLAPETFPNAHIITRLAPDGAQMALKIAKLTF